MKSLIIVFLVTLGSLFFLQPLYAQVAAKGITTVEFNVDGVCGMCKSRIENAALIKGVKMAEWNQKSHILKVVYDANKISEKEVHEAVSQSGHDTEKIKASDETYKKLPACCAFRDGAESH
ncbi:MAG: heavy-metal-associated domain-containing protein [Bacteroidia bacterium]|nr:heavy-metal-associated domain-containing protein [Bacteroidia bacterium]